MGRPAKRTPTFPHRLREVRESLGLSLHAAGKRLGLKPQTLQRYETGERSLRVHELERIARALGVPATALLSSVDPIADQQELAIVSIFRRLSRGDRDRVIRMAAALVPEDQVDTAVGST